MEERLRIAMLSVHSCPVGKLGENDTGGMSVYIKELARQIGSRGHLVDIYTKVHDSGNNGIISLGTNVRLIHLKIGETDNVHKLMLYPHLAEFARKLESFRKSNDLQYDLVQSHYWLSGWVGEELQKWWDTPHVIMFHTLGICKNAIGVGEDETELRIQTENVLAGNCDRIIAATEEEKNQLVHCLGASPGAIGIVPCGVNLELFRPMNRDLARKRLDANEQRVVLFVGRIDPLKGIENLMIAARLLGENHPFKLVIVGGDSRPESGVEKLRNMAQELGIAESVVFTGSVTQEELPPLYSAADVCVVPSFYESFGLVALESLACGTPVVATMVGGTEYVIQHGKTGYIVADNTPRCLADAIDRLFSDKNGTVRSPDYIRESITGFNWSNIAVAVLHEYKKTLERHGIAGPAR